MVLNCAQNKTAAITVVNIRRHGILRKHRTARVGFRSAKVIIKNPTSLMEPKIVWPEKQKAVPA